MSRYEYIGGTSRKFWEVYPIDETKDHHWIVRIKYGRIGSAGKFHTKVFSYESAAMRYRSGKIDEKAKKGYKLKSAPKPAYAQLQQPVAMPKPKPVPVCLHVTLSRKGAIYECASCKQQVEFDNKPKVETAEFMVTVRRFFAGAE